MNAAEALTLARAAGVRLRADGDDLLLESSAPPPPAVLDLMSRHKADIVTMLRSPAPELPRVAEPTPPQPSLANLSTQDRARADAALVAGLRGAARGRPPSWADPGALPASGCFCTCCKGQGWWRECEAPKGWRCSTCHPPDHLPKNAVTEMRT